MKKIIKTFKKKLSKVNSILSVIVVFSETALTCFEDQEGERGGRSWLRLDLGWADVAETEMDGETSC